MARIIAIMGQKNSGKSTVVEMIKGMLLGRTIYTPSLADPIKKAAMAMFEVSREWCYGASELREQPIQGITDRHGKPVTLRYVLQTLGTEWGRAVISEDIWVDILIAYAQRLPEDAIVLVSDCRFVNEARALKNAGAEVWRIDRRGQNRTGGLLYKLANRFPFLYRIGDWFGWSPHPSEREMWYHDANQYVTRNIQNIGNLSFLEEIIRLRLWASGIA